MAKLNATAIARHAQAAGFRGMNLQVSVAIALAESGGNTDAHNLTSREDSRGLWQINVRAHPELSANLFDPAANARAAKAVHAKQGFDAWSVWRPQGLNPRYLLFMPTAGAAVQSLPLSAETGMIGEGVARAGPLDEIEGALAAANVGAETVSRIGDWIGTPANWLRVAYVIVGGALVVGGLIVLARPAVNTATKAVPVGRLLK